MYYLLPFLIYFICKVLAVPEDFYHTNTHRFWSTEREEHAYIRLCCLDQSPEAPDQGPLARNLSLRSSSWDTLTLSQPTLTRELLF